MTMEQAQSAAEQVDAGSHQRRADAVVVEDDRLDQVVEMTLVVRDVDDSSPAGRILGVLDVLRNATNLSQDGIERMLEGAIEPVPLLRAQLVEILLDALPRIRFGRSRQAAHVLRDVLTLEHGAGNVVRSHGS